MQNPPRDERALQRRLAALEARLRTLETTPRLPAVPTYTADHTAGAGDNVMLVSAASGSVTITLPDSVGAAGRSFVVKRTDSTTANTITVATTSSQTIDGASTYGKVWAQHAWVQVVSDGTNWRIGGASVIPEPWQQLTLNAAVAQGSGNAVNGFFYRRTMDGGLDCVWDIKCNATTGNIGSAALPAAYRLTTEQNVMSGQYGTATLSGGLPHLDFLTSGQIAVQSIASTSVSLYGHVRLDLTK